MNRWIVFQQTASEGPGNILPWLQEPGLSAQIVCLWEEPIPEPLEAFAGLILMGGGMSANDEKTYPFLRDELRAIEQFVRQGKPVVGICLGAQLISRALGSRVYRGDVPEIGWFPIQWTPAALNSDLTDGLPDIWTVFHWHNDTFDLPSGATLLASSRQYAHQAYRYGKHVFALQFHPEMTRQLIEEWVNIHLEWLRRQNPGWPDRILKETEQHLHNLEVYGQRLFFNMIRAAPSPEDGHSVQTETM